MKIQAHQLSEILLEEADPSAFLQKSFQALKISHPKITYATLARKMGFSSRSFVRALFNGEKLPNTQNCRRIARGLDLTAEAETYFKVLIERRCDKSDLSQNKFHIEINLAEVKLRKSLMKKVRRYRNVEPVPFDRWPFVYAALGDFATGRTLPEIIQLSGERELTCVEVLNYLLDKGIVKKIDDHYFASDSVISLGELSHSQVFKRFFKANALTLINRVDRGLSDPHSLFHSSVFSVKRDRLPELQKEFQKLLASFAAESEDADGNELMILCAGAVPVSLRS